MKELIQSMSTFELGFNVTITGIVLVFAMLLLLVLVLILFGTVSVALQKAADKKRNKHREELLKALTDEEVIDDELPVAATIESDEGLSDEVVAVISAAISTLYAGSGKKPVIKMVKKYGSRRSAWANAGVADNTRVF
ncbi:MAG: OadG family transporter subunit [Acutalibacteraceae bacterium]|nr:OadG family transporter subunit [Acutalibacteraceae bacterium]